ncbi:MAG: GxxExxY protein [Chitinophagaceae bacterium]
MTKKHLNELTYKVIGCAIEVHKHLGPGLLERVRLRRMFLKGIGFRGIANKSQIWVPLEYKGLLLDTELRLDVLVEDILCVELKAQEGLLPIMMPSCYLICKCYKSQKAFLSTFIV